MAAKTMVSKPRRIKRVVISSKELPETIISSSPGISEIGAEEGVNKETKIPTFTKAPQIFSIDYRSGVTVRPFEHLSKLKDSTSDLKSSKHKCCICMDRNIASDKVDGCLHPVCTECISELGEFKCPKCRLPLSQISEYTNTLITSNQIENKADEESLENAIEKESEEEVDPERVDELFERFYSSSSYPQTLSTYPGN